jgi:hypothetical protein
MASFSSSRRLWSAVASKTLLELFCAFLEALEALCEFV